MLPFSFFLVKFTLLYSFKWMQFQCQNKSGCLDRNQTILVTNIHLWKSQTPSSLAAAQQTCLKAVRDLRDAFSGKTLICNWLSGFGPNWKVIFVEIPIAKQNEESWCKTNSSCFDLPSLLRAVWEKELFLDWHWCVCL